jgi:hypothetical protein
LPVFKRHARTRFDNEAYRKVEIDGFVDADFAGQWPYKDKADSSCVKSCTGYVIKLSNCPVIWGSRLQGEIVLSTMEAEYNALSLSMRE